MKSKKLKFPRDGLNHNHTVEWWYFNGHLADKKGKRYAFMDCLFRADAKKSKIPIISNIPIKHAYFAHSIFSNISKNKVSINVYPLAIISKDSFSRNRLYINYTFPSLEGYMNYDIEEIGKFKYRIKSDNFDLVLTSRKKPFLEGKKGFLNFGSKSTYYYSLTNLEAKGEITVNKKRIKVKGKAWMDHQWANAKYSPKDKWSWFNLQLDNNIELVVFEFITKNSKYYFGGLMGEDGKSYKLQKVKLTPLKIWKSKKTGAIYPVSWRIKSPSENMDLVADSLIKNQEVLFGSINYLENPISVKGMIGEQKVKGVGFMELVGYPIKKSKIKLYEEEIKDLLWNTKK